MSFACQSHRWERSACSSSTPSWSRSTRRSRIETTSRVPSGSQPSPDGCPSTCTTSPSAVTTRRRKKSENHQRPSCHRGLSKNALPASNVSMGGWWQDRIVPSEQPPLIVLDAVRGFLDERGLGEGELSARLIGECGCSNFSFLLERDGGSGFVLRRPPRPPLPPTAHDVVRESRLQLALAPLGIRVPNIRAVCEDESLLGVPFYVMDYIDGHVLTTELPPPLDAEPHARSSLAEDLVDTLVEIHAADVKTPGLAAFTRPGNYNERQVRRFAQLWEINQTRELPEVVEVGTWLAANVPEQLPATVVHGDYRLGNMIVTSDNPQRIAAVLDWEMGTLG